MNDRKKTVLVTGNDVFTRDALALILKTNLQNFDIRNIKSCSEACIASQSYVHSEGRPPDVLVICCDQYDKGNKRMSGAELAVTLRRRFRLPIIMVAPDLSVQRAARESGIEHLFIKQPGDTVMDIVSEVEKIVKNPPSLELVREPQRSGGAAR